MNTCHEIEPRLAAHAFDALDAEEQIRVERHLAHCPECREALARLSELPALLDLAGSAEAPIHPPPPSLEASVIAGLPRHRRPPPGPRRGPALRRPRAWSVAAGAVACVALIVAGVRLSRAPTAPAGQGVRVTLTASMVDPTARAVVRLLPHPWGTEVDLTAHGLAPTQGSQIYELWFVSPRGRVSAGTFVVGPRGSVTVRLAAAAHAAQYEMLGITREPDGLNPTRRGPNVLRAALPA